MSWELVYEKAIKDDGTLFFPQKLSHEFLDSAKRTMGSYLFANQYLNEIIPTELQTFKKAWFSYFSELPKKVNTFVFIDPALSESDTSDFTGVVVVSVDAKKDWYVRYAKRQKLSPTALIDFIFKIDKQFSPNIIGIESVAYQKSLLYFLDEEMRRRNALLPIKAINPPTNKTKEMRILSLVPRIEWGHLHLNQGLQDLELELLTFPRGSHDDLIDALASVEYIAYAPSEEKKWETPPAPNHHEYESYYINNLRRKQNEQIDEEVG